MIKNVLQNTENIHYFVDVFKHENFIINEI